jgi:hypothetical protein
MLRGETTSCAVAETVQHQGRAFLFLSYARQSDLLCPLRRALFRIPLEFYQSPTKNQYLFAIETQKKRRRQANIPIFD